MIEAAAEGIDMGRLLTRRGVLLGALGLTGLLQADSRPFLSQTFNFQ